MCSVSHQGDSNQSHLRFQTHWHGTTPNLQITGCRESHRKLENTAGKAGKTETQPTQLLGYVHSLKQRLTTWHSPSILVHITENRTYMCRQVCAQHSQEHYVVTEGISQPSSHQWMGRITQSLLFPCSNGILCSHQKEQTQILGTTQMDLETTLLSEQHQQ